MRELKKCGRVAVRIARYGLVALAVGCSRQQPAPDTRAADEAAIRQADIAWSDAAGTKVADRGKYVAVWKKQPDETWKTVADIVNSTCRRRLLRQNRSQALTSDGVPGSEERYNDRYDVAVPLGLVIFAPRVRNHPPMDYEIDVAVKFPESTVKTSGATLYLRLEDITYADAPAELVVEVIVRDVSVPPSAPLRATLRVPQDRVQHKALYSVRAHLDADGDGKVSVGDWISTQVHPVLTRGNPTRVTIPLKMVG